MSYSKAPPWRGQALPGGNAWLAASAAQQPRLVPPRTPPWQWRAAQQWLAMAAPQPPPPWAWRWQHGKGAPQPTVGLEPVDEQVLDLIVKMNPNDKEHQLRLATFLLQASIGKGDPMTSWEHPMYRYCCGQGFYAVIRGETLAPKWLEELHGIIFARMRVCTNHQ